MTIDEVYSRYNAAVDARIWIEHTIIADITRRYGRGQQMNEQDILDLLTIIADELPAVALELPSQPTTIKEVSS